MLDCWRMAGLAAPINMAIMFEGGGDKQQN
jgi:hypothetical protein